MPTITFTLDDEHAELLRTQAADRGITPEALALIYIEQYVNGLEADDEAATEVVEVQDAADEPSDE
jgi:hypothetical protein